MAGGVRDANCVGSRRDIIHARGKNPSRARSSLVCYGLCLIRTKDSVRPSSLPDDLFTLTAEPIGSKMQHHMHVESRANPICSVLDR